MLKNIQNIGMNPLAYVPPRPVPDPLPRRLYHAWASLFYPPSSTKPEYFSIKEPVAPVYLGNYQIVEVSVGAIKGNM